jgi:hydrogenase maturation protein HypF
MRFHRTLASAIRQISEWNETLPFVLGGGVFQNKILVDLVAEDFEQRSIPFAIPSKIPINDGGIAAGQLAIASAIVSQENLCA